MLRAYILAHLIPLFAGTVIAPLALMCKSSVVRAGDWYERQSPAVEHGVAIAAVAGLTALCNLAGVNVPSVCSSALTTGMTADCIGALSSNDFLTAIVGAGFYAAVHLITKSNANAAA